MFPIADNITCYDIITYTQKILKPYLFYILTNFTKITYFILIMESSKDPIRFCHFAGETKYIKLVLNLEWCIGLTLNIPMCSVVAKESFRQHQMLSFECKSQMNNFFFLTKIQILTVGTLNWGEGLQEFPFLWSIN